MTEEIARSVAAAAKAAPTEKKTPRGKTGLGDAIASLFAVCVALVFVFPIYWAFSQSLRNPLDTFTVAGFGIPWVNFEPTLGNWTDQLSTPETARSLINSTFISTMASLLAVLLGAPAAYAIARFRFHRWRNRDITVWFLSQRVLPPVATVVPFYLIMRSLNLLDTHLALILINATFVLPFVVVILRQTFLDLPIELEEAALIDGAGHLGAFLRVALPLAAPSMAATALIIFAFTWNEFLFAVAISSDRAITVPVHIAGAIDTRGVQFWFMGVRAMTVMIPPVIIALVAQRYIVRGLTLGAVRG
jgi:multiple sugar transport system permease protein